MGHGRQLSEAGRVQSPVQASGQGAHGQTDLCTWGLCKNTANTPHPLPLHEHCSLCRSVAGTNMCSSQTTLPANLVSLQASLTSAHAFSFWNILLKEPTSFCPLNLTAFLSHFCQDKLGLPSWFLQHSSPLHREGGHPMAPAAGSPGFEACLCHLAKRPSLRFFAQWR